MTLPDVFARLRAEEDANPEIRIVRVCVPAAIAGTNPPEAVGIRFGRPVLEVGDSAAFVTADGIVIPIEGV